MNGLRPVHGEGQRPAIYQPGTASQVNDFPGIQGLKALTICGGWASGGWARISPDGAGLQPWPDSGSVLLGLRPRLEWSGPLAREKRADGIQSMGSGVGAGAMLMDHDPGNPGGETPPSTAGGTPAATEARFMGSALFENDLLKGHEPGIPGGETPPSTAGGTPAATEARFMGRRPRLRRRGLWRRFPAVDE